MQRMDRNLLALPLPILGAGLLAGAVPLAAQSDELAMLSGLSKGEWTVKYRGNSPERKICVETGRELIQLEHDAPDCSRYVVDDEASKVTVQYTCRGKGYGRTNIRRESAQLVQIESQGISSGQPFKFAAEARRTGPC
ncbi:MAG: hypothetical protein AAFQ13_02220 [Pseudomonadota bacterium]